MKNKILKILIKLQITMFKYWEEGKKKGGKKQKTIGGKHT